MQSTNRFSTPCYLALPALVLAAIVLQPASANAQMTSVGINCADVQRLQLLKQDNMRAGQALIECGIVQGGREAEPDSVPPAPPNVQVSNRACTDGQSCTHSENMVWQSTKDNKTTVVNYNDHNPADNNTYSGTSYSTDGGVTFHEIHPAPFGKTHGQNFGDPIVVFNSKLNKWFAGDLVSNSSGLDCGFQGIGLWTSLNGIAWTKGSCPHVGSADDRESMWVDNETTSAHYGRMYVSFNDFNNGGALDVVYSDNGTTWVGPVVISNTATFMRDVQVTGSPRGATRFEGTSSTVFVASMDEGGGGFATRQNVIFKSLDGGATWTKFTMGARFPAVGDSLCSSNPYFAAVNPIWRHMGWGEPAVGPNGVVHYAFARRGTVAADKGDIYYTKSKDNGKTWSAAVKLNTDKDAAFKTQWMPSVSSDQLGKVTVAWYDRSASTAACVNVSDAGCKYQRMARQSKDNGTTWLPEFAVSTGIIAEPDQQDPGVQSCYAGDYDYDTANNGNAFVTWTDGSKAVGGVQVQNVDFAKVPLP